MDIVEATGLPLIEGIDNVVDIPHTISFAVAYRLRINDMQELPKDKRPPRNLWDKPHRLSEFIDDVFDINSSGERSEKFIEFDLEDVE